MGATIRRLFRNTEDTRILLAGLDAAGKTTILYMLKLGEVVTTIPTIGFNVETIKHGNISFTAWDVGSRDKMSADELIDCVGLEYAVRNCGNRNMSLSRPLMRHYFANTQALIFVIDSNDHDRMSEVVSDLKSYLDEDELRDSLLLILANKQDLPNAKSPTAISEALQLHTVRQHCHIIPTIARTGDGLQEGLEWIAENLNKRHLPKDSDKQSQLKQQTSATAEHKNFLSYFDKPWQLFYSLFIGSDDLQTTK